jgi:hypothetical protein
MFCVMQQKASSEWVFCVAKRIFVSQGDKRGLAHRGRGGPNHFAQGIPFAAGWLALLDTASAARVGAIRHDRPGW